MNPNVEPNETEEADAYLETFKTTHIVTVEDEVKLRQMLVDYYSERKQGSPVRREESWTRISKILATCKKASGQNDH